MQIDGQDIIKFELGSHALVESSSAGWWEHARYLELSRRALPLGSYGVCACDSAAAMLGSFLWRQEGSLFCPASMSLPPVSSMRRGCGYSYFSGCLMAEMSVYVDACSLMALQCGAWARRPCCGLACSGLRWVGALLCVWKTVSYGLGESVKQ